MAGVGTRTSPVAFFLANRARAVVDFNESWRSAQQQPSVLRINDASLSESFVVDLVRSQPTQCLTINSQGPKIEDRENPFLGSFSTKRPRVAEQWLGTALAADRVTLTPEDATPPSVIRTVIALETETSAYSFANVRAMRRALAFSGWLHA